MLNAQCIMHDLSTYILFSDFHQETLRDIKWSHSTRQTIFLERTGQIQVQRHEEDKNQGIERAVSFSPLQSPSCWCVWINVLYCIVLFNSMPCTEFSQFFKHNYVFCAPILSACRTQKWRILRKKVF